MIFETRIRARYAETDQMGVVYHANYLAWLEMARTEIHRELGFPYGEIEEQGLVAPVVDVSIHYGQPLRYDEVALVRTRIVKLTPVRVVFAYEVYREDMAPGQDKPCVSAESCHTMVDRTTFKPINMKKRLPELFAAFQAALEPEE